MFADETLEALPKFCWSSLPGETVEFNVAAGWAMCAVSCIVDDTVAGISMLLVVIGRVAVSLLSYTVVDPVFGSGILSAGEKCTCFIFGVVVVVGGGSLTSSVDSTPRTGGGPYHPLYTSLSMCRPST